MTKKPFLMIAAGVLALTAGLLWGPQILSHDSAPAEFSGHANWVDQSANVAELTTSADLIVKATIEKRRNRIHTEVLPVYAEDNTTVIEQRSVQTAFTDVKLQVVDTLKGTSEETIFVLQTGGTLNGRIATQRRSFTVEGDPLFEVGTQHMLFLHEITGDGVHSIDQPLYRIVNPLGRMEVLEGGLLKTAADLRFDAGGPVDLPVTEEALRFEIQQTLDQR